MDIEKLKAEFEQSECFKKLEHVAQYTFFEFGAYLKRTDVPDNVEKKCGHLITALIFSWGAWKEAKAQAVPEWAVIVPRLSANYLFNKVPELGFKHQDEKDTVLYHLNYMASGFKESAKRLVEDNHAKQKAMIEAQELANESE